MELKSFPARGQFLGLRWRRHGMKLYTSDCSGRRVLGTLNDRRRTRSDLEDIARPEAINGLTARLYVAHVAPHNIAG